MSAAVPVPTRRPRATGTKKTGPDSASRASSAPAAGDSTHGHDDDLARLADQAGILVDWQDAHGKIHTVPRETLMTLLERLGLPAGDASACRRSLETLATQSAGTALPPLMTATVNTPIALPSRLIPPGTRYTLTFESGDTVEGSVTETLPAIAVPGYHTVRFDTGPAQTADAGADGEHASAGVHTAHTARIAIAPARCFSVADALAAFGPAAAQNTPSEKPARPPAAWGVTAQVYSLRRGDALDGGLGDFSALREWTRHCAQAGAAACAISPMHAMFSADPGKCSPYSPSSRLFLNVLHVDPAHAFGEEAVKAALEALGLGETWAALGQSELIDWPAVARARLAVLRHLFDRARDALPEPMMPDVKPATTHADASAASSSAEAHGVNAPPGPATFAAFRAAGGDALENHARFEAMHAARVAAQPHAAGYDWREWPETWRDPTHPDVAAFAAAHRDDVDFHLYLQWLADRGLAAAQAEARAAGMAIGLIADLAVGCDNAGSQTWSQPDAMLRDVTVGAPPDIFNQAGQAWGLTTFSPRALVQQGFAPFIDMMRTAFAHAGGIRVDHILGLRRLWLVPAGASARDGAYLRYPIDDMLRLLALESWRHRAVVIGEDLGTVPEGLREQLSDAGLMGMRVLWFERNKEADADTGKPANTRASGGTSPKKPSRSDIADITDLSEFTLHDEFSLHDGLNDIAELVELDEPGESALLASADDETTKPKRPSSVAVAAARTSRAAVAAKAAAQPSPAVPAVTSAPVLHAPANAKRSDPEGFVPPPQWSREAIAMTTTHDLPTITGWWEGQDIAWRHRVGQMQGGEAALRREQADRLTDRARLWSALGAAGLVPADAPEPAQAPVDAALRYVAASAAPLALFPLEDVLGLETQPNLPGSIDEHPNWRRRLPLAVTALSDYAAPLSLDKRSTPAPATSRGDDLPTSVAALRQAFDARLHLIDIERKTRP